MSFPLLAQITMACLLGGILSLGAAALIMFGLPRRWIKFTVSFSIGLLLSMALLNLLPEALESGLEPRDAFTILLGGILCFFMLEKIALWHHINHSTENNDEHSHATVAREGALAILIGDGFHNFIDGLLIAGAFLASPSLGWSTTLAIIAHEVPQEAGDFAVLLSSGWTRARALFWNIVSSLAAVAGGITGYYAFDDAHGWIPVILTIAASSFLYVAVADLMPRLRREHSSIGWNSVLLIAGIAVVVLGGVHIH